jgi:hypothetical protein
MITEFRIYKYFPSLVYKINPSYHHYNEFQINLNNLNLFKDLFYSYDFNNFIWHLNIY